VSAPVQIHYGTEDGQLISGTPPEWSQKAYQAFSDSGKQAELIAYEGESHSFIGDQWWAFMERSAQFFDKYVK
jgi:dienelactone hydrolase